MMILIVNKFYPFFNEIKTNKATASTKVFFSLRNKTNQISIRLTCLYRSNYLNSNSLRDNFHNLFIFSFRRSIYEKQH